MELIIKPTEACNFACTFCSSSELVEDKKSRLDHQYIFDFLDRFPETNTIIVNGGDPLMVPPSYYEKILDYIEQRNLNTKISLTTNLWAFYKKPSLWTPLFRHPKVGVCTSFNYGETRRVTKDRVYTEELFWKVSDLLLKEVGYRPQFISVITDENEDTAIDNVRLAKKMDVECKLNYAMASGRENKPYLLGKTYQIYLEIIRQGLAPWEFNSKELVKSLSQKQTICPRSRTCDKHIRNLNPEGDYYSCGSLGDDKVYPIDFQKEMASPEQINPLQNRPELAALKSECFGCPLFSLCNGCRKTIMDLKTHNMVAEHCGTMKSIESELLTAASSGFTKQPSAPNFEDGGFDALL